MRRSLLLLCTALASCVSVPQQPTSKLQIALTIDDLPLHAPYPPGDTPDSVAAGVSGALKGLPAYGFVNAHWVADRPDTASVLPVWRAAGLSLGNHGWTHRHLSEMSVDQFEDELVRNEAVLARTSGGSDWHWFRYPFLDEGKDEQQRAAARAILAKRGYKIAAVTMDFSDWAWTAPYARCSAAKDDRAIAELERMYVQAATEGMAFARQLSREVYGRDIPYVVLLHESPFEARMLPRLIALYRSAGFRFVSLPDAERDPAYADQTNPSLPAEPKGLEGKAIARGIALPARTDFSAALAAICPGGPTASIP
jgi:peptidoglycan/xylan/chitin deacetylase (PgdA/CDA1 family)